MINNLLESKAERLLQEAGCWDTVPINIIDCAKYLGLQVQEVELESDVSGFLAINNDTAVIGVNVNHGPQRKRFTIAHELSHFRLHAKKEEPLFIDKERKPIQRMMFRDASSSTGEFMKEREANAFAAALLMPKKLVEDKIKTSNIDNMKEAIKKLAEDFGVSTQAMSIRLTNLDIIDYNAE